MVVYSKKYFIFLKVGKIGEKGSQYLDIYSLCYYSPACLLHSTLGDILFSGGKFLFICQVKPSTVRPWDARFLGNEKISAAQKRIT